MACASCLTKGFLEYVKNEDPDILCLQETKLQPEQVELELPGYHQYWYSAEKKGYSGTAVFTKAGAPVRHLRLRSGGATTTRAGSSRLEYPDFYLVYRYTPNSPGRAEAPRLPDAVGGRIPRPICLELDEKKPVVVLRRPERGPSGD